MITFPNCKLNLGLNITEKRSDGFHNLETVFVPIALQDVLEFVEDKEDSFTLHGQQIPGSLEQNIVLKALRLIRSDFPSIPPLAIHLLKHIPTGAGLGGGSANGSFMLSMLNDAYSLNLTQEQLLNYGLILGSDCPFFIKNIPCYATGRGEFLQESTVDLSDYIVYLIKPDLHIDTKWAFSNLTPKIPSLNCNEIVQHQPVTTWRNLLVNDFEEPIFRLYPELLNIKESLYQAGATYASMSGSGSTVFGLFDKKETPDSNFQLLNSKFEDYFTCKTFSIKK